MARGGTCATRRPCAPLPSTRTSRETVHVRWYRDEGNVRGNRAKGCAKQAVAVLLALSMSRCDEARAFPFRVEKDPVSPFVMYGAVYKKYWIEDVVDNKVAARRKGITAIACTGAVSEGNATSIDRAALPTVPNESMPDAATCQTREGITPDVACLAACDASCRASVEQLVERQNVATGYALDQDDQNKVIKSCVRQCKYECTKPGQFSSFAAPFKR